MIFQMQEGYLTLGDGDWKDSSVNMLAANHLPTKGSNLVITREALPDGMALSDYLLNQKSILSKELSGLKILVDAPDEINELPAHFLAFTWDNQGNAIHQMMFVINNNGSLVNITSTIPGEMDDESRSELIAAMRSFKPGPAPLEIKDL